MLVTAPSVSDPTKQLVAAALDGHSTPDKVNKLLEQAAVGRLVAEERRSLNQRVAPEILDVFYRRLEGGVADEVLDELRGGFDEHVTTIDEALQTLGTIPTDSAEFVNRATPQQLSAWQALKPAIAVLDQIAGIATAFGPHGAFPLVRNPKELDVGIELG